MNSIRTISVITTVGNPTINFMLNIPFEVDLIRLVDCRSVCNGFGSFACIPTVSFIPNQPLCIGNTGGNINPVDFHFKNAKPINGLHTMSFAYTGGETGPQTYVGLILEFWNTITGIPLQMKQTQWQNACVSVSSNTNSFPLDILFPVDEIIIEDMFFQNFNSSSYSSLTFYTDFLPLEPIYTKTEPNSNKCRTAGSTIGMCNLGIIMTRPNKIRYRFAQPLTIRGNYRIWFEADPISWGAGLFNSSVWGSASFLFKFISYR